LSLIYLKKHVSASDRILKLSAKLHI